MLIASCIPVIPSADLEKSLRFWVDGLGLSMDRAVRQEGRLVGCMVHNERLHFWLNQRAGSPNQPENYEGAYGSTGRRPTWLRSERDSCNSVTPYRRSWIVTTDRASSSSRTMTATPIASG
jgi:hypothetical protein